MNADVIVIGAGIVGCAVARSLTRDGLSVAVLDPDPPGQHASWAAAGMLAPQAESESPDPLLPLLLQAGAAYPGYVAELEAEMSVSVGYSAAGMLLLALDAGAGERLSERFAWQSGLGLAVDRLTSAEARELEPVISSSVTSALWFAGDHAVDNRLLTRALHASAAGAGAQFHAKRVVRVELGPSGGRAVTSDGTSFDGRRMVLAAGSWSGGIEGLPRRVPVEPAHGELISYNAPGMIRHTIAAERGYLVPRADGRIIAGATLGRVGFNSATTPSGLAKVKAMAAALVPSLADLEVADHWAGLRPGTPDDLPILGPDPEHPSLIYATGHYRNGILLGPITGSIVADLIAGRPPAADIADFSIDRFES